MPKQWRAKPDDAIRGLRGRRCQLFADSDWLTASIPFRRYGKMSGPHWKIFHGSGLSDSGSVPGMKYSV